MDGDDTVTMLVDEDIRRTKLKSLMDEEEFNTTREKLLMNMSDLNEMFRFYCGFGHGSNASGIGGNTATMSMYEFNHLVNSTKLFNTIKDSKIIQTAFHAVNVSAGGETLAEQVHE